MQILAVSANKPPTAPTVATRWYRVQCGGYETITHLDGTQGQEFVLDGFNLELPDTGFFGWGVRDAIAAAALEQCPTMRLIDFWPLSSAPATK